MASEHDDQLIATLADNPAWQALERRIAREGEQHFNRLARHFARYGNKVDYEQLQYDRGRYAGMKHILDEPRRLAQQQEAGE